MSCTTTEGRGSVLCFPKPLQAQRRSSSRRSVPPNVDRALEALVSSLSGTSDDEQPPPRNDGDDVELGELRWLRAGLSTLRTALELAVHADSETSAPRLEHGALLELVEQMCRIVIDGSVSRRIDTLEAAEGAAPAGSYPS